MGRGIRVVIASGKGGTGKTTLSVAFAKSIEESVVLLDCDVEEPNCHIFFDNSDTVATPVQQLVPVVETDKCTGCGKCSDLCQFSAIISFAGADAMVFPDLCHSCGGCKLVCPTSAITEEPYKIGMIEDVKIGAKKALVSGRLDVGHAMSPPIIKEVLKYASKYEGVQIVDAPPGTSCPFVTTAKDSDYVIFVIEPTPFGANDLKIAVDTLREIGKPFGVIINRMEQPDNIITEYCCDEDIKVLAQIPQSRYVAECYSQGLSLVDAKPELKSKLRDVIALIKREVTK